MHMLWNKARQANDKRVVRKLSSKYKNLVEARQHFSLFQHHDAITGTSKQAVMHDYAIKLFAGLQHCQAIEKLIFQYLMASSSDLRVVKITEDFERTSYEMPGTPLPLELRDGDNFVMVFNPLAQEQVEVISIFLETLDFCIHDHTGNRVDFQINPTWNASGFFRLDTSFIEVVFIAKLPPLSITTFKVSKCKAERKNTEKTEVICMKCPKNYHPNSPFSLSSMPDAAIQLENSEMILTFDQDTNWLTTILDKRTGKSRKINLEFSGYETSQFRNGAYLFKTDGMVELVVFDEQNLKEVVVVSGQVFSEVTVVYEAGSSRNDPGTFVHTVRLYHTNDGLQNKGVYIENDFNLGSSENFNDVDIFMRFKSDIANGDPIPEFYTDMNSLQMQKRSLVKQLSIEGNTYPVTTMTYLEDDSARLNLVVDHAQGAASWKQGWLEVFVDRRSTFDDGRGMGEGVLDNRETTHKYWLILEAIKKPASERQMSFPSQLVNLLSRKLNNPALQYIGKDSELEGQVQLIQQPLPCDIHLFNVRTLTPDIKQEAPSNNALFTLHKQSSDCDLNFITKCHGDADMKFWNLGSEIIAKELTDWASEERIHLQIW